MLLYDFLVFSIIKAAKSVLPNIADEQLEDGTYYSMNMISALYIFFLSYLVIPTSITLSSDTDRTKGIIISFWFVTIVINYILILRKDRWKRLVTRYDYYPTKKKEALAALTFIAWAIVFIALFSYYINLI